MQADLKLYHEQIACQVFSCECYKMCQNSFFTKLFYEASQICSSLYCKLGIKYKFLKPHPFLQNTFSFHAVAFLILLLFEKDEKHEPGNIKISCKIVIF